MALSNAYPNLMEVLGTYFHQDWKYESGTAAKALATGITDASVESRRLAISQLKDLLDLPLTAEELDKVLWWQIGCEYIPAADGWSSTREWLEHVNERISESLASRK
jgi:hypothetical protein